MKFKYKVIDDKGEILKGITTSECNDVEELYLDFRRSNYKVIALKKANREGFLKREKRITYKELSDISYSIGSMLKAGLSINKTLSILKDDIEKSLIKESFNIILQDIFQGKTIHESFSKHSNIFPKFFLSLLLIGEKSGNIDSIFIYISTYYENLHVMNEKIKKSLRYPLIVMSAALMVTLLILNFSIPTFVNTINNIGGKPSIMLEGIMKINQFINENIVLLILLIILVIYFIVRKIKSTDLSRTLLKSPVIGKIVMLNSNFNIITSLKVLTQTGTDIINTMELITRCIENTVIKEKMISATMNIRNGKGITESLSKAEIFDTGSLAMIRVGEETGEVDKGFTMVEKRLKEKLEKTIESTIDILQPCFILFLAVITVFIIISVLYPMMDMMNSI